MSSGCEIEVLRPGALTTIQDLGRPGLAHLGVSRSGAADKRSLALANRLAGNQIELACLETTLVGPHLRFTDHCTFALSRATAGATLDGAPLAMNTVHNADGGQTLKVAVASAGLRTYIAFAGGIDCDMVLGSRSSDLRSGLGPAPLAAGDRLAVAEVDASVASTETDELGGPPLVEEPSLHVLLGPREDWFTAAALETLISAALTVSPQSDRVGVRLSGPPLAYRSATELRSEGLVPGAIQVPPDGQPIIMLADHPTTGGYPVIAVVHSSDLWLVGQLRPGQQVRLHH